MLTDIDKYFESSKFLDSNFSFHAVNVLNGMKQAQC